MYWLSVPDEMTSSKEALKLKFRFFTFLLHFCAHFARILSCRIFILCRNSPKFLYVIVEDLLFTYSDIYFLRRWREHVELFNWKCLCNFKKLKTCAHTVQNPAKRWRYYYFRHGDEVTGAFKETPTLWEFQVQFWRWRRPLNPIVACIDFHHGHLYF